MLRRKWWKRLGIVSAAVLAIAEIGLRWGAGLGNPVLYAPDPQAGMIMAPDQHVTRFGSHNDINHFSMRSGEISAAKPANTYRVMCVGDSVTYGTTYVDQSLLYTSILGRTLAAPGGQHIEVLNASCGGWSPANELGYLKSHGTFQSDLIILTLNPTDLGSPFTTPKFGMLQGNPDQRPFCALEELVVRYGYAKVFPPPGDPVPADPAKAMRDGMPDTYQTLGQIRKFANDAGAVLAIVYTTGRPGLGFDTDYIRECLAGVHQWADANHVPMVDLTSSFGAHPAQEVFQDGIHLRAAGQALIAEAVEQSWPNVSSGEARGQQLAAPATQP